MRNTKQDHRQAMPVVEGRKESSKIRLREKLDFAADLSNKQR